MWGDILLYLHNCTHNVLAAVYVESQASQHCGDGKSDNVAIKRGTGTRRVWHDERGVLRAERRNTKRAAQRTGRQATMIIAAQLLLLLLLVQLLARGLSLQRSASRLPRYSVRLRATTPSPSDPIDCDAFVNALVKSEHLTAGGASILKKNGMDKSRLLQCDLVTLRDHLKLPIGDAMGLIAWVKREYKEEEEQRRQKQLQEEEQRRQMQQQERQARTKRILLLDEPQAVLSTINITGEGDFRSILTVFRSIGLNEYKDGKVLSSETLRTFDSLQNEGIYVLREAVVKDPADVLRTINGIVRARADFDCKTHISAALNLTFEYVGRDLQIAENSNELGDIDSFFVSSDGTAVVLLERKDTINANSEQDLNSQITNTYNAFCKRLTDEAFRRRLSITNPAPKVYVMLYCQAGDDKVVQGLVRKGIYVVKDGTTFFPGNTVGFNPSP